MGPVFAAFGLYLSSRFDLLPMKHCVALATTPDWAVPMPESAVRDLIRHETGFWPEQHFSDFESDPVDSRLLHQVHRARLHSGETVRIKLSRPGVRTWIKSEIELLPFLRNALQCSGDKDFKVELAIAEFQRSLDRQMNLERELERRLQRARQEKNNAFKMPAVHRQLCSAGMLTVDELKGVGLDDLLAELEQGTTTMAEQDRRRLARQLCQTWLQDALWGSLFPTAPALAEIVLLPDERFAFAGDSLSRLTPTAQSNLLAYLIAASAQDVDKACACLLPEVDQLPDAGGEEQLLSRLRQIAPFRDGGWHERGGYDQLIEHLILQWQVFNEHGYRATPNVINFWRSLGRIATAAQRLAPRQDALREGLEDFRVSTVWNQFCEMLSLSQLADDASKYASLAVELPRTLDRALTQMADGSSKRSRNRLIRSSAAVVLLLLLLTAVVLLPNYISSPDIKAALGDRFGAAAFLFIGALLLRVVSSRA